MIILVPKKILVYNEISEGFVYSKALNFKYQPSYIDFGPDQSSILLSYRSSHGDEPFRNVLINLNGDTLNVLPNHYKYKKNTNIMFEIVSENIQFLFNNKLNFKFWLCDTVFALDRSNKINPYLIFDSHGKQLPLKALANFSPSEQIPEHFEVNLILRQPLFLF